MKTKMKIAGVSVSIIFLLLTIVAIRTGALTSSAPRRTTDLQRFYRFPLSLRLRPGLLVRIAPLTDGVGQSVALAHANAYRILYTSESSKGRLVLSGGMLFVPTARAPESGRPVVAWAHPTRSPTNVAPSSSSDPLFGMQPWLSMMIDHGWDVVATDYAGLGTPGRQEYLNGLSEAHDIVFSVEAAWSYHPAMASVNWVAWGHSYGGHAVLWTASEAPRIFNELHLLGVVAAAPVANVVDLAGAEDQAWKASLAAQEPPVETTIPVLIVQGTRDISIPLANTRVVDTRWCSKGADVTLKVFPGATHISIASVGSLTIVRWISRRFDHRLAVDHCKV